jgi:hypothetical protein
MEELINRILNIDKIEEKINNSNLKIKDFEKELKELKMIIRKHDYYIYNNTYKSFTYYFYVLSVINFGFLLYLLKYN